MRYEIKNLSENKFERGDYALAVIKDEKVKQIFSTDCDVTTEIFDSAITHKGKIYIVQFLSCDSFSSSFPMELKYFYKKHGIA